MWILMWMILTIWVGPRVLATRALPGATLVATLIRLSCLEPRPATEVYCISQAMWAVLRQQTFYHNSLIQISDEIDHWYWNWSYWNWSYLTSYILNLIKLCLFVALYFKISFSLALFYLSLQRNTVDLVWRLRRGSCEIMKHHPRKFVGHQLWDVPRKAQSYPVVLPALLGGGESSAI
jgi:hypothetical protein